MVEEYKEVIIDMSGQNDKAISELENVSHNYSKDVKYLIAEVKELDQSREYHTGLIGLFEHFIVKNDLDEQYIDFLKDVSKNETIKEYKKAASKKLDFYKVEFEDGELYQIDDQYGWTIEERELAIKH